MLHPAELKRRHEHEVELAELVGMRGVVLEPGERRGMQVEDRVAISGDLLRVGFAMEHPEGAAVPLGALDLELPGGEREQVGRRSAAFRRSGRARHGRYGLALGSAPFATACQSAGTVSSSV